MRSKYISGMPSKMKLIHLLFCGLRYNSVDEPPLDLLDVAGRRLILPPAIITAALIINPCPRRQSCKCAVTRPISYQCCLTISLTLSCHLHPSPIREAAGWIKPNQQRFLTSGLRIPIYLYLPF